MNWHISHVLTNVSGVYCEHTYIHIIEKAKQDSFAVLAILEDVLHNVSRMGVTKVILRSDNAMCYHSKEVLLAVPLLNGSTNAEVLRYSFSEPQSGKSSCDRAAATVKRHLHNFVTRKQWIETPDEFFNALSKIKLPHTTVALATVIAPVRPYNVKPIPESSSLTDFTYDVTSMRMFKFFNIGPGKVLHFDNYNAPTSLPHLKIRKVEDCLEKPHAPTLSSEKAAIKDGLATVYYRTTERKPKPVKHVGHYCPDETCNAEFTSVKALNDHIRIGIHQAKHPEQLIQRDYALQCYSNCLNDLSAATSWSNLQQISDVVSGEKRSTTVEYTKDEGWAHRTSNKNVKFTVDSRAFLAELFEIGEQNSAAKYSAQEAVQAMVTAKRGNAQRFDVEDILSAEQIARYFSKLSRERKNGKSNPPPAKKAKLDHGDDIEDKDADTAAEDNDEDSDEVFGSSYGENEETEVEPTASGPLRRSERISRINQLRRQQESDIEDIVYALEDYDTNSEHTFFV